MKILFILPRFHTNQIGTVNFFLNKGHKVYMHVANKGLTEDYSIIYPHLHRESYLTKFLKILKTNTPNNPYYLPRINSYLKVLKKIDPDIVIVRDHCQLWTYLILLFSLFYKYKVILTNQIRPESLSYYHRFSFIGLIRRLLFNFRLTFFNTYWTTSLRDNYLNVGKLPRKCFYLPFIVKIKNDLERYEKEKINYKIISIGKYIPRKSHDLLLKSFKNILDDFQFEIELTVIGEFNETYDANYFQYLNSLSNELKIQERVNFLKNVPYFEMEKLYLDHDLVVVPAFNEIASISVLEALGYGLPAICSDTCGTKGYINNFVNGAIFKSNDQDSLSNSLRFFIHKYKNKKDISFECKKSIYKNASEKEYNYYLKKVIE